MQNALNAREDRDDSVKQILELADGSDCTPINSQAAEIQNTVARLRLEYKLCKAFLASGNITEGPNMDKPVQEVESRVSRVRTALTEICRLDIRDPEFEANFRRIKNGVFKE